ncbi:MAG: Smr/MutS family protein [Pelovirga sp.]
MAKKPPVKGCRQKVRSNNSPFSSLKGLAVTDGQRKVPVDPSSVLPDAGQEDEPVDFAARMSALGVDRLAPDDSDGGPAPCDRVTPEPPAAAGRPLSDDELFLEAMASLNVPRPDPLPSAQQQDQPPPRRMKRLRRGDLVPQATLDLHGLQRRDVAAKMRSLLQNARHHGWEVLLVITGKGLHSEQGEAVLRQEVETFITTHGHGQIAEWGRAPRQYGGDGALVLFLRRQS